MNCSNRDRVRAPAAASVFYFGVLGSRSGHCSSIDPAALYRSPSATASTHLSVLDGDDPPAVRSLRLLVGDELEPAGTSGSRHATHDPGSGRAAVFCCDPFDNLIEFARHAHWRWSRTAFRSRSRTSSSVRPGRRDVLFSVHVPASSRHSRPTRVRRHAATFTAASAHPPESGSSWVRGQG
jgi:hypothetical protein